VARERKRGDEADIEVMRKDFLTAVGIAKEVAPYRHARFSYVKVAGDRTNIPDVPEGVTARELRAELFSEIARLGVLPTKSLPRSGDITEPQSGVRRGHNGSQNK
jgi:hypothetical protein